ncbi:MAG: hypothetical protein ACE5HX_11725 [bacterium]
MPSGWMWWRTDGADVTWIVVVLEFVLQRAVMFQKREKNFQQNMDERVSGGTSLMGRNGEEDILLQSK